MTLPKARQIGPRPSPPTRESGPHATGITQDQTPAWVLDLLLGVAVTLVIALVISADQDRRQSPDAIAYAFACGFGALMLVRRRFPAAVLVITMFGLFAYYTLGYPAIGLAVPVAAALYSAAELGRLWVCIIVSLTLISVSTYFRLQDGTAVAYLFYELVSTVALMAAAIALGVNTRSRRALRAEQEQTARLIEQEHAYRAEQRIQAERVRMARELHDVIGHSISVIALQSDVARESLGNDDAQARSALGHIRAAASDTMRELRSLVKLLRSPEDGPPTRSIHSMRDLSTLIENARASGLTVGVSVKGDLTELSAAVDTAIYRIIQESLTNVIRHALATHVDVTVSIGEQGLELQVTDNGATAGKAVTAGSGIEGMRERARLLGGNLTAQHLPSGGFQIHATLPREETP